MSFPSAIERVQAGDTAETALLHAMEHDTPLGFKAIQAVAEAGKEMLDDPLAFIRERVPEAADHVLRFERINDGRGLKVDFDPLAPIGAQIARLLGTDAARPLIEQRLQASFGFANCCGVIAGKEARDTTFSVGDQIRWQHSIDC